MSASDGRFTQASPWNQQPALWVLTSLYATWCILGLVARCFIRRNTWLLADTVHVLACVIGAGSWIAMFVALAKGAGKSPSILTPGEYSAAGKAAFTSTLFLLLAKGFSTASHLSLLRHMLAMPYYVRLCRSMIWLCLAVYVAACLTVSVHCSPGHALSTKHNASCGEGTARWTAVVTLAYLQSLIAVALPALAFWHIQKPVRTRLNIISWFSVPPLIDLVPLSLALWQYKASISSTPSGTGLVGFLVCLHSSLCWNLLYPTVPALRPTALSYATLGAALSPNGSAAIGSQGYSHSHSNGNRSINNKVGNAKELEIDEMPFRPTHSGEGNHISIGAISNEDDRIESSHGRTSLNAIQVTQEYHVSAHRDIP